MTAIFLDANVFLYATGAEHPLREPARQILRRVAESELDAITSTEVLQELLFVLTRRGRGNDGIHLARSTARMFPDLLPVTRLDMVAACDLLERYPEMRPRDAVHAATMLNNGIGLIFSADGHFDGVQGIRRLPLDAPV